MSRVPSSRTHYEMSLCLSLFSLVSVSFLMSHSFVERGIFLCKKRVAHSTAALWAVHNLLVHPSWCNTEDVEVMCTSFHSFFGSSGCQFRVGERSDENPKNCCVLSQFWFWKITTLPVPSWFTILITQNLCRIGGVMCNVKVGSSFFSLVK